MRVVPWPAVSYIHRYRRGEKGDKRGQRKMEIGREGRGWWTHPNLELDVLAIEPQLSKFLQKIDWIVNCKSSRHVAGRRKR